MKAPSLQSIISTLVVLAGLAVVGTSYVTVRRMVKQNTNTSQVSIPAIPKETRDAIRSRQQTVQDINFDHEQTGVQRNPFTPYSGSSVPAPTTDTAAAVSTTSTPVDESSEPLPAAPQTIASPSSGTAPLSPTGAY